MTDQRSRDISPSRRYNSPDHLMNSTSTPNLRDQVQGVIDLIRPAVQGDGGDIELVNVTPEGEVQIRFHGACHGCPSSNLTLHMGIERSLRDQIPQVTRVVAVP